MITKCIVMGSRAILLVLESIATFVHQQTPDNYGKLESSVTVMSERKQIRSGILECTLVMNYVKTSGHP